MDHEDGNKEFKEFNECKNELTDAEIEEEVNKLEGFFDQIPEDKKVLIAHNIIFHTVLYSSHCMCHGLDILDQAKIGWADIMGEEIDDDDDHHHHHDHDDIIDEEEID